MRLRANGHRPQAAVKRIWIWFQYLSRFQQIGFCVLAAHVAVILIFALNHVTASRPNTKKAIAIRTLLEPKPLARQEPAAPAKKEIGQNPPQNKSAANEMPKVVGKKTQASAKTEVKKKPLLPATPKKEAQDSGSRKKNSSAAGTAGSGIDNELLQQITENLEAIAAPAKTSQPSNFAVALPSIIEIQTGIQAPFDRPGYGETVSAILQSSLDLPEFGKVVAKIEIDANGTVARCEILETRSQKNAAFLKKRLQELAFPCFNEFGLTETHLNFTITFQNVENR